MAVWLNHRQLVSPVFPVSCGIRSKSLRIAAFLKSPQAAIADNCGVASIDNHRPSSSSCPLESLLIGGWVKLICGASFEDVADVRNLSLVYTLAGVDCIDCAADPAVVQAVNDGIEAALQISSSINHKDDEVRKPWVMVSINDDEDLHFRKAEFDPSQCPTSCPRPCERICPASAIQLDTMSRNDVMQGGVMRERCYGCGRCIPVCPLGLIVTSSYIRNFQEVSEIFQSGKVDAVEIHTSARHLEAFKKLWDCLHYSMRSLKLVAISMPDLGDEMISTMWNIYNIMRPGLSSLNLWQLDGRPMSGDIGAGATNAAVNLAVRVAEHLERPPGFLQLAGGTNAHTIKVLKSRASMFYQNGYGQDSICRALCYPRADSDTCEKLMKKATKFAPIAGVAYGGYARKIVCKILDTMDQNGSKKIEDYPLILLEALKYATTLVDLSKQC